MRFISLSFPFFYHSRGQPREPFMSLPVSITDTHCHLLRTADAGFIRRHDSLFADFTVQDDFIKCRDEKDVAALVSLVEKLSHEEMTGLFADLLMTVEKTAGAATGGIMIPSVTPYEGLRNYRLLRTAFAGTSFCCGLTVHFGIGTHPMYARDFNSESLLREYELLSSAIGESAEEAGPFPVRPRIFVGEIGFDRRFKDTVPPEIQSEALREQLRFAAEHNLPVNIHGVGGDNEILHELKRIRGVRGIIHAFTGNAARAGQYLRHGLMLGIGPMLLAANSHNLEEAVMEAGPDCVVAETDFPYMYVKLPSSPVPGSDAGFSESTCGSDGIASERVTATPDMLGLIERKLACLFKTDTDTVRQKLAANVSRLFAD